MGNTRRHSDRGVLLLSHALAVLAIGLVLTITVGQHGLRQLFGLRERLAQQSAEIYRRTAENQRLLVRLQGLREDPRVLEEVARADLGLVGENELTYVFVTR